MHGTRTAVGLALLIALPLSPSLTLPAGAAFRDGACEPGEGQTVIVDWSLTPEAGQGTDLVRCIALDGTGRYPVGGPSGNLETVLLSAGIDYALDGGLITDVNGIPAPEGHYWHFTGGEPGGWLGRSDWYPEPDVDSFVGVALTEYGVERTPVRVPELAVTEPEPEPGPSEEPTDAGPSDGPTASPGPAPTPSPDADGTPTTTPPPTPTAAPTAGPPPQAPPSQPPPPAPTTAAPSAPPTVATPTPEPSPTAAPTPTPSGPPELESSGAPLDAPSTSPSPVWGREDTRRSPVEASPATAGPTAPWLGAALTVVVLGGLGTAAGVGLRSMAPAAVEDE